MSGGKLPAIHLYPGDWLRDSVSGCSLPAQGLWLRLLFVAHDAERCGFMFANDSPESKAAVARRCGCNFDEFETLIKELFAAGVPGIQDGFVISRRMVRDAKLRGVRARAGRKGGKQTAKRNSTKREPKTQANIKQNTDNENDNDHENESETKVGKKDSDFERFWQAFPSGRKKSKSKASVAFLAALAKTTADVLIAAATEYAASDEGRGDYVKMPSTWLNCDCWLDDREAWRLSRSTSRAALKLGASHVHDPRLETNDVL